MQAKTVVKVALVLVGITVLFYWQEVWAWVSAKTWQELTGDLLGFVLKWFFLALFAFLAVQIPHYVSPWLKLARVNSRRKLKEARRGRVVPTVTKAPNVNKQMLQMLMQSAPSAFGTSPKRNARLEEEVHEDIQLKF